MHRKWISLALAVAALLLAAPVAAATSGTTPWYFGASAIYDGVRYNQGTPARAPNALYGVNLFAGYQVADGISLEAGYVGYFSNVALASATEQGLEANAVFRVPVNGWLDLDGAVGLTYLSSDVHLRSFETLHAFHSFNFGWRVAAGPELTLLPNVGWRTLLGYQQGGLGRFNGGGDITLESGLIWHL